MQVTIEIKELTKKFKNNTDPAIYNISTKIYAASITGIVGPDGAGKTTLLRLIAGLLTPSSGEIKIMGEKVHTDASETHMFLSYMPQRFGLYEDLSVMENLNFYASLRGISSSERKTIIKRLLSFSGLEPFTNRLAGRLSGGMKQKLGLACSLIHHPRILLLDEPSVGVDPLSRQELWHMVNELAKKGITVVWTTSYLDEAQNCSKVLVLDKGKLLFEGSPEKLTKRVKGHTFIARVPATHRRYFAIEIFQDNRVLDSVIQGQNIRIVTKNPYKDRLIFTEEKQELEVSPVLPRFEDAVISLMGGISKERVKNAKKIPSQHAYPVKSAEEGYIVEVENLTKRFGKFTAVNNISFKVRHGEVFGLLGPNGAGKSTTFRMLCGLLKPTSGRAKVAGIDILKAPAKARGRIGYMAQKFSLYGDITAKQNLEFFGGVYGLKGQVLLKTVRNMIEQFQLEQFVNIDAKELPLGFKQRLSMACAIMHSPEILFLDEPTSGVDPITRREFWIRINSMVQAGTSIIITTHFLDEAEYCDRIAIIHQGKIIAIGSPDSIKNSVRAATEPTLEEAFIELIKKQKEAAK